MSILLFSSCHEITKANKVDMDGILDEVDSNYKQKEIFGLYSIGTGVLSPHNSITFDSVDESRKLLILDSSRFIDIQTYSDTLFDDTYLTGFYQLKKNGLELMSFKKGVNIVNGVLDTNLNLMNFPDDLVFNFEVIEKKVVLIAENQIDQGDVFGVLESNQKLEKTIEELKETGVWDELM